MVETLDFRVVFHLLNVYSRLWDSSSLFSSRTQSWRRLLNYLLLFFLAVIVADLFWLNGTNTNIRTKSGLLQILFKNCGRVIGVALYFPSPTECWRNGAWSSAVQVEKLAGIWVHLWARRCSLIASVVNIGHSLLSENLRLVHWLGFALPKSLWRLRFDNYFLNLSNSCILIVDV